ncbi:MAG TPA: PQQ-binding-like beta-propeller repeat protein [Symbiobacteriaceae bacterium]|jgi:outer membrane protein assembly factor BamB
MSFRKWAATAAGLLLLGSSLAASAAPPVFTDQVTDYGRNRWRTHFSPSEPEYPLAKDARPVWEVPLGLSRSQPLVIRADWSGNGSPTTRVYHLAGDRLWALNAEMTPPPRADGQSAESYRQQLAAGGFILWSTPATAICADPGLRAGDDRLAAGCAQAMLRPARPFSSSQAAFWKGARPQDDVIYVGYGFPAAVAAIRATDGKVLGAYIINARGDRGIVGAPLVYAGDTVVIGTTNGDAVIIRGLASGTAHSRVMHIGGRISASPVPLGESGFLMASDARWSEELGTHGYLMAYSLAGPGVREFAPRWPAAVATPSGIPGESAIDDMTIYTADKHGRLYALRLDTGELIWCRQFPGLGPCQPGGPAAPAFINNGPGIDVDRVYFVFRNNQGPDVGPGQIVALDKGTGRLIWQQPMNAKGNTAPVPLDNVVIVGDTGGYVQAYDKVTGKPVNFGGYPLRLSTEPYREGEQGERWWEPIGGTATQMTVADGFLLVGVNSESDERTVLKAYRLHPLPDLVMESLSVPGAADPDPGFTARVRVSCRNCGAPVTTSVSLTLNGMELPRQTVTFRPDNGWSVSVSWVSGPMPAGNAVTLVATVDPENTVEEADKTNNSLRATVVITAPQVNPPDDGWGSRLTN